MKRRPQITRRVQRRSPQHNRFLANQGLTLIELLVAVILTSVVILVAWSGLISAKTALQSSESRAARQSELNRTLDFMSAEIRMSRAINQSGDVVANGGTVTLEDVVTHGGVPLAALGDYGTLGLYLEKPIPNPPSLCPVGGPNAGLPPPVPADYDPIVYDIRPSPSGWLKPRMLARYGRVPGADGSIDPCSSPVSSDPMMDALSASVAKTPDCPGGVLSGEGGFYACVADNQANLFFQSEIDSSEINQVSSAVASRVTTVQPATTAAASCSTESSLRSSDGKEITLTFVNKRTEPVKLYWLDYTGTRQYQNLLTPSKTLKQKTFEKHPWVVTDIHDNCLGIFVGDKESKAKATIE